MEDNNVTASIDIYVCYAYRNSRLLGTAHEVDPSAENGEKAEQGSNGRDHPTMSLV